MAFVIVEGFPKADPDIEQAETTTQAAEEARRNNAAHEGILQKEGIIRPRGSPRNDHQQNASYSTDQNEKKN